MRANLFTLALIIVMAQTPIVLAETIEIDAPIAHVTLFVDRAEVTRRVRVDLPAGDHTLVVADLPGNLIAGSLRAQTPGVRVNRVALSERASDGAMRDGERELVEMLEALVVQHRVLADQVDVQEIKLDFIRAIGQSDSQAVGENISRQQIDVSTWQQAWSALTDGAKEALDEIRSAELKQQELEKEIERIERQLDLIRNDTRTQFEGRIDVSADTAGGVDIDLVYQVGEAGWQPGYTLDLDTERGEVQVIRQAMIRQASGEDWRNVAMTLSTAIPGRYAAVPELQPWFIDVQQPVPLARLAESDAAVRQFANKAAPARLEAGEFFALYNLDRPTTIPSDRSTHVVTLAEEVMEVDLKVLTAPARSTNAILTGEITSPSAAPLLAGRAQLFRDGTFVADNWIEAIQPGERVRLSFGIDDRVRVARRLDTGQRSSEGLIRSRRRSERTYVIDVANNHTIPIEITVLDRLPVAQDDRIEVSLLDGTTPPTTEDVDGRRGVLAWSQLYEPGEEVQIVFGFAVTRPDGVEVPGF